jgi:hypothetical protein
MQAMLSGNIAPIAFFVYKRPEHTRRTLAALSSCPEFRSTPLLVFADAPRKPSDEPAAKEVRRIVNEFDHPIKEVLAAEANRGLAKSLIVGITTCCARYGRVIVLEDDILVSRSFLRYANDALEAYKSNDSILAINSFIYGGQSISADNSSTFLPFTHPWGWATWDRAWRRFDPTAARAGEVLNNPLSRRKFNLNDADDFAGMLELQLSGKIDSWWIRWYLDVFLQKGLGVFPPRTLVKSIGDDGSATHSQWSERLLKLGGAELMSEAPVLRSKVCIDSESFEKFRHGMRPRTRRVLRMLGRLKRMLS